VKWLVTKKGQVVVLKNLIIKNFQQFWLKTTSIQTHRIHERMNFIKHWNRYPRFKKGYECMLTMLTKGNMTMLEGDSIGDCSLVIWVYQMEMSIRDWLLTLKRIEAPKILSWKFSRSGICMEFFKPSTWCKYFISMQL
jgi:hypothetical protein